MSTSTVVVGTAVVAAAGYAIADWLARVAVYAEKVEDDAYCTDRPTLPTQGHSREDSRGVTGGIRPD